jgi:hypothetical protein
LGNFCVCHVLLQEDEIAVFLNQKIAVFAKKVALCLFAAATPKERNDATQPDTDGVAGGKETHLVFIGLQYTVPPEEIWMALTRHRPEVPVGTLNGIGVNAGIGVLAVVATAPSPT